jgi:hypothetical protein
MKPLYIPILRYRLEEKVDLHKDLDMETHLLWEGLTRSLFRELELELRSRIIEINKR